MLNRLSFSLLVLILVFPIAVGAETIDEAASIAPVIEVQPAETLQQILDLSAVNSSTVQELNNFEPEFNSFSCSEVNRCMMDFACSESCYQQWCSSNGCFENYCSCMQSCAIICF